MRRVDSRGRSVEVVECLLRNQGRDVARNAASRVVLVDDDHLARPLHGFENGLLVHGRGGQEVDDLGGYAVVRQGLGRLLGNVGRVADADDRYVVPLADDARLADGELVRILRHVDASGDAHELPVVEEYDGVVIANGGDHQALRGVGVGWHHALEAGEVREDGVEGLGVLGRRVQARAHAGHDGERQRYLAAEHVAHLGGVVGDLVGAHAEEAHVHKLDDGTQSCGRRADARPDESGLGDGRVANAVRAELGDEALGQAHRSAPGVDDALVLAARAARHVLAHDDNGGVALHLLSQRLVDGLYV